MKSRIYMLLIALVATSALVVGAQDNTKAAAPAAAPAATAAPAAKYGGVDNCKMCHPDIYTDWEKTAHASSFDLLVNTGQQKNPECLPCHTTGYKKGGYVDEATTPGLKGTTCEACHGPGADHMGDKTKIKRVPSGAVCAGCHQAANIHTLPAKM